MQSTLSKRKLLGHSSCAQKPFAIGHFFRATFWH